MIMSPAFGKRHADPSQNIETESLEIAGTLKTPSRAITRLSERGGAIPAITTPASTQRVKSFVSAF
jgi:hypothetical protein